MLHFTSNICKLFMYKINNRSNNLQMSMQLDLSTCHWLYVCCLTSLSWIFHSYRNVTTCRWRATNFVLCSALRALSREGSFSCHTSAPTATWESRCSDLCAMRATQMSLKKYIGTILLKLLLNMGLIMNHREIYTITYEYRYYLIYSFYYANR